MSTPRHSFPLFNRIVVLVVSSGLLIGLLAALASPGFRNQLDFLNGFLLAVFALMACCGIWLSVFWKNRTPQELEEEQSFPTPGAPVISEYALACRFSTPVGSAAVFLDGETGMIHFRDCHVPRGFLTSTQAWFSCPVTELKGVHVFRYRGEWLTIVTASGKAVIPAVGTDYHNLHDALRELVPSSQPGFSTDHPMIGFVFLAGALIGLFAGVFATPRNATDAVMGLYVLGGAALGVLASYGLVVVGDRFLKVGLTQPIGFGMVGCCAGLFLSRLSVPLIGWNLPVAIIITATGAAVGFAYGVKKQSREQTPRDEPPEEDGP